MSRTKLHWNLKAEYTISTIKCMVKYLSSKLKGIIDLLCDGNCHSQSELQKAAQLSEYQIREVVSFLSEYGFAEMTNGNEKLKLTRTAKKLFTQSI